MNKFESASILAGMSPNEEPQVSEPTNLHVITGEVVSKSEDGTVMVSMDGLVFSEDDTQYIEMDTIGGLEEGDEATIILAGENGSAMSPLVVGSPGSVDRIRDTAETAQTIANSAQAVAEATNQHFFSDDGGIHVTEATQEEWDESHSGANVLINSIGQLFRDGLNNLLALLPQTKQTYTEAVVQQNSNQLTLSREPTKVLKVLMKAATPEYDTELSENQYSVSGNIVTVTTGSDGANYEVTYVVGVTSLAIFDGLGNDRENIVASFSEYLSSIGYFDGRHVEIDNNSIDMCNGSDVLWSIGGEGSLPRIWTEAGGYTIGAEDGIKESRITGGTSFMRDFGAGSTIDLYASGQSASKHPIELILFSPSADSAATKSKAALLADNLTLLIDDLTISSHAFSASAAVSGLLCHSSSETEEVTIGSDTFAASNRALSMKTVVSNSSSSVNGHSLDFLIRTDGIGLYDYTDAKALWTFNESPSQANLTRGSAAASWSNGIVRLYGKVVTMTINSVKLSSALASGSTSGSIATIPTGYRPSVLQRGIACIGTSGNYGNVWFVASNTGNVAIANRSQSSIPTTAEIHMQITYIID